MRTKTGRTLRCSYVVAIKPAADARQVRELARYFGSLGVAGCEVIVLDSSSGSQFEENRAVLRWVARHLAVREPVDPVRVAVELAACDRVIVAGEQVRYEREDVDRICAMLEVHEAVEPEAYVAPLPWWGAIDAGRTLVRRSVDTAPGWSSTFAFRLSALRPIRRSAGLAGEHPVRRLAQSGVVIHGSQDLFVRSDPGTLASWLGGRTQAATGDLASPGKAILTMALVPALLLLAAISGFRMAVEVGAVLAAASVALAMRGRSGASEFFPLHACLFAPVSLVERSVGVFLAMVGHLRGVTFEPAGDVVSNASGAKAASGR